MGDPAGAQLQGHKASSGAELMETGSRQNRQCQCGRHKASSGAELMETIPPNPPYER